MAKIIEVVAGALVRDNKVLLASRPSSKSYTGFYEFPGGKIEPGESASVALVRELKEELGITVKLTDLFDLLVLEQDYPEYTVELIVLQTNKWGGEIVNLEHQEFYWQDITKRCKLSRVLPTTTKILEQLNLCWNI